MKYTYTLLILISLVCAAPASAAIRYSEIGAPCPEGQMCNPLRPTLYQCAQRISLATGAPEYVDLVSQAPRFIDVELARAIMHHPLCYADETEVIIISRKDADQIALGEAYYGDVLITMTQHGRRSASATTQWGLSYITHPAIIRVLAFVAEDNVVDGPGGQKRPGVNIHQPPAIYPVTTTIYNKYLGYLLGRGTYGYLNWRRFGIAINVPIGDISQGVDTHRPPEWNMLVGYWLNQDLYVGFGASFPRGKFAWAVALRPERPMATFIRGLGEVIDGMVDAVNPFD